MFVYFFINLTLIGFKPIKSSKTKICPSQLFEAPIPMVGILICFVIAFTIEPMINAGKHHTKVKQDGWTVETLDGRLSAQWEHTLAITSNGVEVLTARSEEAF